MNEKFMLDTSAWLAYFYGESNKIIDYIESENILFSSVISILEVKTTLKKKNIQLDKINKVIEFISKRSIMIDATQEICEEAGYFSLNLGLETIESIMYSTAIKNESVFLTTDKVFRDKKDVILL